MKKFFAGIFLALGLGSVAHAGGWYGEDAYLRCNPDVAQAVRHGDFQSGYHHYQLHGQYENRITDGNCHGGGRRNPPRDDNGGWDPPGRGDGGWNPAPPRGGDRDGSWHPGQRPPAWFNEREYLRCYPDVRRAVRRGTFVSGWQHYQLHGYYENRPLSCR